MSDPIKLITDILTEKVKMILHFLLSQGHSIRRGQSHDCAERGDRVRPDSASAGDGGLQHHHAHGLSEPDRGTHPERIRALLLLQLKRSEASGAEASGAKAGLETSLNVLELSDQLDFPFSHSHKQLQCSSRGETPFVR